MPDMNRFAVVSLVMLLIFVTSGCESLHFYQQAATGQVKLLSKRVETETLLASDIEPELRHQLELASDILEYAAGVGLASDGAFTSYTETDRRYVIWNVFAADPLQLSLKTSCFPVAGCVSYRGYFSEQDARRYASGLRLQGYDVYVAGVAAYSTLGWFEDPLLDTFLFYPHEYLAALMFHELAHQIVYIKGDTRFNESMATAVERFVLEGYLMERGKDDVYQRYLASRHRSAQVISLIDATREALKTVYATTQSKSQKLAEKERLLEQLVASYDQLAASWSDTAENASEYRRWMSEPINNAKLETVADYHEYVPGMLGQLRKLGLEGFVAWVSDLSDLSFEDRRQRLLAVQPDQSSK